MKTEGRIGYPASLRARITILFVMSAVLIEGMFAAFWVLHLSPRLEAEMQSDINSLAQAHALSLANALSEKEIRRDTILNIIDGLLLLEDPVAKTPLVLGVELTIDYDVLHATEGDLDLSRWQGAVPKPGSEDLLDVEIPLFSRTTKELLGIARFYSSKKFYHLLRNDVMKTFLMATCVLMALLFACWLFLIALLRPLQQLADGLGSRDADDTALLPPLKGRVSQEIRLVKTALDEFMHRIHEHTRGLLTLNMILATQQEASLDGILVVDDSGQMLSFNRRFADMWGIPEEVMATRSDALALQSVLDKVAAPEAFLAQVQYLYHHPEKKSREELALIDGRTFERYSSPMLDVSGKYYGRVWYFHDITEYKLAMKTLFESRSLLAKAEKMAKLGSWEFNEKTGRIYFSDHLHELLGLAQAQWTPNHIGFLDRVHPDDRQKIPSLDEKVSQTGEPVAYEFRSNPEYGPVRYFEARNEPVADNRGHPLQDDQGRHYHRMGFFLEVTERKQAEEQIRRLNREKLALLAQVTAMVSHELRNPLGVIRTSNYYLQRNAKGGNPKLEKHFKRIDEQISMCNAIIEDLLEYTLSRESHVVRYPLAPWMEHVVKQIEENQGIEIALRLPPELAPVYHDREKMMKAMVNLLTNSTQAVKDKAAENAGIGHAYRPEISIDVRVEDNSLVIEVADNGVGMSAETRERAFEPLFTTRARGIGLGLANVKRIVDEHGGRIALQSWPDQGTRIILRLPNEPRHSTN